MTDQPDSIPAIIGKFMTALTAAVEPMISANDPTCTTTLIACLQGVINEAMIRLAVQQPRTREPERRIG